MKCNKLSVMTCSVLKKQYKNYNDASTMLSYCFAKLTK